MSSAAMFCKVEQVEELLQETVAVEKRMSIERAIVATSAAIQNYCRQTLALVEDDEITIDCKGGRYILLPQLPVISVGDVVEDDILLRATDDYKLGQHGLLYRVQRTWSVGVQNVTVIYSHGFQTMPEDIVDVCTRAAARIYQAGLRADALDAMPGVTAESLGDHSVSYSAEQVGNDNMLGVSAARALLLSEKDILNRYRV